MIDSAVPSTTPSRAFDSATVGVLQDPIVRPTHTNEGGMNHFYSTEASTLAPEVDAMESRGSKEEAHSQYSSSVEQQVMNNPMPGCHPGRRTRYSIDELPQVAKKQIHAMRVYYTSEFNLKRKGECMRPATFEKFRERVLCG